MLIKPVANRVTPFNEMSANLPWHAPSGDLIRVNLQQSRALSLLEKGKTC
jgi:hypothetical protein